MNNIQFIDNNGDGTYNWMFTDAITPGVDGPDARCLLFDPDTGSWRNCQATDFPSATMMVVAPDNGATRCSSAMLISGTEILNSVTPIAFTGSLINL